MAKKKAARKGSVCLTSGCAGEIYARGLCTNCFQAAHRMMNADKATDEELVAAKLILPPTRGKRAGHFRSVAERRLGK